MLFIGDFDDPMAKYENLDLSKYSIELTAEQCVYLQKVLPKDEFRFQPEDATRAHMTRIKNRRKKNAKSAHTDSAISNSDKMSLSERNIADSSSIQSKKVPSTPSKAMAPSDHTESLKDDQLKPLTRPMQPAEPVSQLPPAVPAETGKFLPNFGNELLNSYLSFIKSMAKPLSV